MGDGEGVMTDLIPTSSLARELGVNRRTLARWAAEAKCPSPRVFNRRLYFKRDEIEAWKATMQPKTSQSKPGNEGVINSAVCKNDSQLPEIHYNGNDKISSTR